MMTAIRVLRAKQKPIRLTEALEKGSLEAAILERDSPRESKFRLLSADEIKI
jgi:hypothetical protein